SNGGYWRSLDEYADTPEFRAFMEREYPQHVHELGDPISRRRFLALMGASLALAGLNGCNLRQPPEKLIPYVRQPQQIIPGKALYFATAMPQPGGAIGLLVESHEGRPTKVEGNPQHPSSMGATDIYSQASVLGLYDPDRSQAVTNLGRIRGWDDTVAALQKAVREKVQPNAGARFRILTDSVNSPTLAGQIEELIKTYREMKWYQYEPAVSGSGRAGALKAFGEPLDVRYDFTKADVVVTLDADVFGCGPGSLRYARDFASRRRPAKASDTMNRHYAVESTPTPAGMAADHRLPLRAAEIEPFARELAAELGVAGISRDAQRSANARWITEIAKDLNAYAGRCAVVPGADQPPALHALVHAINDKLGNIGKTVVLTEPVGFRAGDDPVRSLRDLGDDMDKGLDVLLIIGGNPAFTAPADLNFVERMQKVPLRIHVGLYDDETARQCHWHIPEAHFLETWGDARGHDGTATITQPLIAPLYAGRSALEVLTVFAGQPNRPANDMVRAHWRKFWEDKKPGGTFEAFWRKSIHDGVVAGTAFEPKTVALKSDWSEPRPSGSGSRRPVPDGRGSDYEIIFRPDPTIHDGRYANNAWLQELPKPLTRITWDNALLVSPNAAQALGVINRFGPHGGSRGETIASTVNLTIAGRTLQNVPVLILPGHPDNSATLHYGYGRAVTGKVGSQTGWNAYALRHSGAMAFAQGLRIERTGRHLTLANTQFHNMLKDRTGAEEGTARVERLVRAATFEEFRKAVGREPGGASEHGDESWPHAEGDGPMPVVGVQPQKKPQLGRKPLDIYPEEYPYDGYKWGMVIDLSACTGCNSCVVACQAENNIAVVGKDQVIRGREMHWLRIDAYFRGDPASPQAFYEPMACVHCENAPCEVVCPVEATSHSPDGLNEMTYNRCVGTRYCSNNCPYKVRRFNFYLYSDYATASLKLQRNPDVTVRSRGVMEKCTFCVQRIRNAEIDAKNQNRYGEDASRPQVPFVRDGEIVTACQAACPTQAIVFGDMNDVRSRVAAQKQNPRHFGVLTDLNTRPRLTYLAPVRNPNPALSNA
ncbi:MAG TPA: TAT-variant-translocated molybdopterin oxidoreductase, partial [Gemmataceae bacterium]|nr:TAT-variant-translocated molybdopterin oxidoreductase [Gemmataceae bacterium]